MIVALLLGGIGSWLLTGVARQYALSRSVLDVPNHRSSHSAPTPRGGGVAIVVVTLAGTLLVGLLGRVPMHTAMAMVGGGLLVAVAGWLDDHGGLPARWRALMHLVAALWALLWMGGLPELHLGVTTVSLGTTGTLLGALGIVWSINLFNFMDGIDGIAAGEAISVAGVGGGLLVLSGATGLASIAFLLTAACAGFLVWNWQPAKIFMGDVGSGVLGFLFGAFAVASENADRLPLLVWVLLAGVFIFDATVTLLRRIWRGERWYAAHRSHAYQRAVQAGWTHARVTTSVLIVNGMLAVLALMAWLHPTWLPALLVVSTFLLALCYISAERLRPM